MHVGTSTTQSKTEAMYVPPSLDQARQDKNITPDPIALNDNSNNIHFVHKFKYLGSFITADLTEDVEIETRIKKAWSQMGMLRHFFKSRDVDRRVKFWIYLTGLINTLLWGSESWNLSQSNLNALNVFHHTAIRYILDIKWAQVREQRITNEELRQRFNDIPDVELLIVKRTWT